MDEQNYCLACYDKQYPRAGHSDAVVDVIDNPFARCVSCGDSADDVGGLLAVM